MGNARRTGLGFRVGTLGFAAVAVTLAGAAGLGSGTDAARSEAGNEAASGTRALRGSPVSDALLSVSEDVRVYNEHLTTLASPFMQGRVPGSRGMELAREYAVFHLEAAGFEPAFPDDAGTPFASWYDPFELGGTWSVSEESLALSTSERVTELAAEEDFVLTGLGGNGDVSGRAAFVGYGIENGPNGFNSYGDVEDLSGKVAVMLRFEPMDEEGRSRWTEGADGWTNLASFTNKLAGAAARGAEAVLVVNTPGADDPRASRLSRFGGGGGSVDIPVFMLSAEAGERLVEAAQMEDSLIDLRRHADAGRKPIMMPVAVFGEGDAKTEPVVAKNVGGVMRGTGDLASEWIVVGAHLDHLGMGYFGSRSGPGELHPGADDNASGSAGVLLLAEKLRQMYGPGSEGESTDAGNGATNGALNGVEGGGHDHAGDDGAGRRSILLMLFDGEESGLHGSRHYVSDPIAPATDHALMINWDMIGRIENERLSVSGLDTGDGMRAFFEPLFADSGLEVVAPQRMSGASDHTSFYRADIPVLFGHIDGLHADYHTPADVSEKINRVAATKTVLLFTEMIREFAVRPDAFAFRGGAGGVAGGGPRMGGISVRVGVMPASYSEDEPGIPIAGVSDGSPAEAAGMLAGDRLVRWDGQKIEGVESWMGMLAEHGPGDTVKIGVVRDGEEITLDLTLGARGG